MYTFSLSKLQGSKDSLSRRLTFAQSREYKIGMAIYGIFYLLSIFSEDLGIEWFGIPGIIIAVLALILAYFPLSFSKKAGEVTLEKDQILINPKKEEHAFPDSPVKLNENTKIEINTVSSVRWLSSIHYTPGRHQTGRRGKILWNDYKKQQRRKTIFGDPR